MLIVAINSDASVRPTRGRIGPSCRSAGAPRCCSRCGWSTTCTSSTSPTRSPFSSRCTLTCTSTERNTAKTASRANTVSSGGGMIHVVGRIPGLSTTGLIDSLRSSSDAGCPDHPHETAGRWPSRPALSEPTRDRLGLLVLPGDCRSWHKQTGVLCTCDHYEKVEERLLVIKLDAMGDVLRSTAPAAAVVEVPPGRGRHLDYARESAPCCRATPTSSEILEFGPRPRAPEGARRSTAVITSTPRRRAPAGVSGRIGPKGRLRPRRARLRPADQRTSRRWLEAGVFDDIKRQGPRPTRTAWRRHPRADRAGAPLRVRPRGRRVSARRRAPGVDRPGPGAPVVGLNREPGGRWPLKQWREAAISSSSSRLGGADVQLCCSAARRAGA